MRCARAKNTKICD